MESTKKDINRDVSSWKDYFETVTQGVKLLFYAAITGGVVWHLMYYWIIVGAFPRLDTANLVGYLVSVFGVGIMVVIILTYIIFAPGLSFLIAYSCNKTTEGQEDKRSWIFWYFILLAFIIIVWLAIELFKLKYVYILYILFVLVVGTALILIYKFSKQICDFFKKFPNLFKKSLNNQNLNLIIAFIFSIFLFVLPFLIVLMVITSSEDVSQNKIKGFFYFTFVFLLVGIVNGLIAKKGIAFLRNALISGLFLIFITLALLSYLNFNLILTLPYKLLKLGSVNTCLTIEKDFISKTNLIETYKFKCLSRPDKSQTTDDDKKPQPNAHQQTIKDCDSKSNKFYFHVLSSIGSEYIVTYPYKLYDDSKPTQSSCAHTSTKEENWIIKIPLKYVVAVEYQKTSSNSGGILK